MFMAASSPNEMTPTATRTRATTTTRRVGRLSGSTAPCPTISSSCA